MTTPTKQVSYGRPRLLTHEEILDATVKLGLENVTMKKLSTHLGVGTATLYQYFENRKALVRAAAVHALSDVALPKDTGQHWSLMARDYTNDLMVLLAENPSYMNAMSPTDFGFDVHFKLLEPFLASFKQRGIAPRDTMRLFNQMGIIAYGGAVESVRQGEFEFHDETMEQVANRQFARLDKDDFPNMADVMDIYTQTPQQKADALIDAACRAFAQDIGEDQTPLFKEA